MQGLYGPFTITERVVQKIWLRGDFARRDLQLADGRSLEIRTLGAWNLLGGPDFRGARLVIAGREITGDVEVHFHTTDWAAHGHARDHAYDNVALHVVLFPLGQGERAALNFAGKEIPTLVLLPLLHRDLEEYASDDALEGITERDEWERFAELASLAPGELQQLLQRKAVERWRQKMHFAKLRVEKLGFAGAAHHTALEILGYRHNRAAMLMVAAQFPLAEWAGGAIDPDAVFAENRESWKLQGVRPANYPRTRLRQYYQWTRAVPDWPEPLLAMAGELSVLPVNSLASARARRELKLGQLHEKLATDLAGGVMGGTRFDNLVCDGFLPLVAAAKPDADVFAVWFHWFLGDVPAKVRGALPKLGVTGRGQPVCHGWAQGLLGWMLEREARASG